MKRSDYVYESYSQAYDHYVEWTDEKEAIARALNKIITPKPNMKLLDVGAGFGDLTKKIAPLFSHIDVVEPNNQMYYRLKKQLTDYPFRLYPIPFEQFEQKDDTYDIYIYNHSLTYIKN